MINEVDFRPWVRVNETVEWGIVCEGDGLEHVSSEVSDD